MCSCVHICVHFWWWFLITLYFFLSCFGAHFQSSLSSVGSTCLISLLGLSRFPETTLLLTGTSCYFRSHFRGKRFDNLPTLEMAILAIWDSALQIRDWWQPEPGRNGQAWRAISQMSIFELGRVSTQVGLCFWEWENTFVPCQPCMVDQFCGKCTFFKDFSSNMRHFLSGNVSWYSVCFPGHIWNTARGWSRRSLSLDKLAINQY